MPFQNDNRAHMWGCPPCEPSVNPQSLHPDGFKHVATRMGNVFYICFQIFQVNYFLALGLFILNRKPEFVLHSKRFST